MTTLQDSILKGRKDPSVEYLRDFFISGGSEVVEEKLKAGGWTGKTPVASVGIHISGGSIVDTEIFISGPKEVGRISARLLWGEPFTNESYAKVEPMDLALVSIRGRMVSNWVKGDKLDWALKVHNPYNGKYKVINKLDEESLKIRGASKLSFRLHLALDKGPRLTAKLGVAPAEDVTSMVGNGQMNFPMIQVGKDQKLEILPAEPQDAEFGLGFVPFFICRDEEEPIIPDFSVVRAAISEMFNTACKPKIHTKFTTWKQSASLGAWDAVDPTYVWPTDIATTGQPEDEEEGENHGLLHLE
jgi:hypothetical protein